MHYNLTSVPKESNTYKLTFDGKKGKTYLLVMQGNSGAQGQGINIHTEWKCTNASVMDDFSNGMYWVLSNGAATQTDFTLIKATSDGQVTVTRTVVSICGEAYAFEM